MASTDDKVETLSSAERQEMPSGRQQHPPAAAAPTASSSSAGRIHMTLHAASPARKRRRKELSTTTNTTNVTSHNAFSSSSSSSSEEEEDEEDEPPPPQPEGWRVKLYRLNADGTWDDCGTGRIVCRYTQSNTTSQPQQQQQQQQQQDASSSDAALIQELGDPTLVLHAEVGPRVLLRTRIMLRDAYQRQGDNIITWCEPYFGDSEAPAQGVDLALSFQDNAGCLDIWRQITQVQSRAADWFRRQGNNNSHNNNRGSITTDMAHAVAAAHHASMQQQQQQRQPHDAIWGHEHANSSNGNDPLQDQQAGDGEGGGGGGGDAEAEAAAVSMAAAAAMAYGKEMPQLPSPPKLANLEEVADRIAGAQQLQQRESLAVFIAQSDCSYLKCLLSLFPSAEARNDFGALATLAACIKTILLLNDPSIIDLIVSDEAIYEQVCSTLEYDPDLRDKANHRWFLRERAKFRTVVLMEDPELIATIHRAFRVTYLRDTLLRPTMDESSLSTLTSLQTFTHADVVKGVTSPPPSKQGSDQTAGDSYLVKVMRVLGKEVREITQLEWDALEKDPTVPPRIPKETPEATVVAEQTSTSWKQYLAPQDGSLAARRMRRRGCLFFFRELFNMVRVSLQPSDKDDFYAAIVCMEVEPSPDEAKERGSPVNILSLLGNVLSDPTAEVSEKGAALEIIAAVAMHDPGHIRRECLEYYEAWKREQQLATTVGGMTGPGRPEPNDRKQVLFRCGPDDLLASLLFLLATETDAGLLLQTSEIMRIVLDTDMQGEHGPMGTGMGDEAEVGPPGMHNPTMEHTSGPHNVSAAASSEQNQFLAMFYEHYVQWLVAPFQYTVLHTVRRVPDSILFWPLKSPLMKKIKENFRNGVGIEDPLLKVVSECATRSSFAVELLSFCVRVHLYRMKFFLLRSRVLGSILKLLARGKASASSSGDRCLKLSALRFLRSILSVKDEFYHRHIIQHNLFAPVFEAFRSNPVGDNLVSSSIVEMCDFIHNQRIKSLIEYIVTKHLSAPVTSPGSGQPMPSLEDVSNPYVTTLTKLRKEYEEDLNKASSVTNQVQNGESRGDGPGYFSNTPMMPRVGLSEKALEDQRKFREADEEESYFDSDDDEGSRTVEPLSTKPITTLAAVDEVDEPRGEVELHRAPRMFSLSQAPLLNNASERQHGRSSIRSKMVLEEVAAERDGNHTEKHGLNDSHVSS